MRDYLLIMKRLVLCIVGLVVAYALYQIVVIAAVTLLVQRVVITTASVLFLLANYVLIVLQQLTGLVLGRGVGLILIVVVLVIGPAAVLSSGLCPVRDNLRNVDDATIALSLPKHWGHHPLREVV